MHKLERRTWKQTELRVAGTAEAPKIQGYAAVFESPSEDMGYYDMEIREEIDPHAFDNVLAANPDVRALFNHSDDHVLGRTSAGTLRLSVDARGLFYDVDPPDTQLARDLMVSMRRKDITGSSFGFVCKRDQWTDNADGSITRRILEFDQLIDVSPVTFPAYPSASSEARSLPASMPAEMRKKVEQRHKQSAAAAPGSTEHRDDGDYGDADEPNNAGCVCGCPECMADDCANCTDPDCDDPNCAEARSLHRADELRRFDIAAALTE